MGAIAAPRWKKYVNAFLAGELSTLTRYYDRLIQWLPRENDSGILLAAMDAPVTESIGRDDPFPDLTRENEKRTAVLVNGTFNHAFDIQGLLVQLKSKLSRTSRVVAVLYNPYLRWLYNWQTARGFAKVNRRARSSPGWTFKTSRKWRVLRSSGTGMRSTAHGNCWGSVMPSTRFSHWFRLSLVQPDVHRGTAPSSSAAQAGDLLRHSRAQRTWKY